jgi:hypothetical protein
MFFLSFFGLLIYGLLSPSRSVFLLGKTFLEICVTVAVSHFDLKVNDMLSLLIGLGIILFICSLPAVKSHSADLLSIICSATLQTLK